MTAHPVFDTRIFYKEAKTLVEAGYSVTLIAPHTKNEEVSGIRIVARRKCQNRFWRMILGSLETLLLALKQRPDIYHFHDPVLFLLLVPFLRMFCPQSRIVYDVHENYAGAIISQEKHWLPGFLKPLLAFIIEKLEKSMSQKANLIVTAGPDIKEHFLFHHNAITIKNYAPLEIINSIYAERDWGALRRKSGNKVILSGSLTNVRAVREVVQALEFVNPELEARLVLIGPYHDLQYKAAVEKERGYKHVDYIGPVILEDLLREVLKCRMAIMCFHHDPNLDSAIERSNKLFEYMALGVPVVVSERPAWQEIVEKHQCGLWVNAEEPRQIAKVIEQLLSDPERAAEMGRNARRVVLRDYAWRSEGEKLIRAYAELPS